MSHTNQNHVGSQISPPLSITQRNLSAVPRDIRRSAGHRLSSSSDASTLPSLAASPASSSICSSPTSLLLNSQSLSLYHNTSFSTTSTGIIPDNLGDGLSSSPSSPTFQRLLSSRSRSRSRDAGIFECISALSPVVRRGNTFKNKQSNTKKKSPSKKMAYQPALEKNNHTSLCYARAQTARQENDSMVYLDGPQIYTCVECRTHLTSHDEIISKSFHGRHGRAYLFDQCVNYTVGAAEDRRLITGLHSVCDIFCKRCKTLIGWTYSKAYEPSQKYKEGKFIIEKINLHMEANGNSYDVNNPAGERPDRWRIRAMSWGNKENLSTLSSLYQTAYSENLDMVWEYQPGNTCSILSNFGKTQLRLANVEQDIDFNLMPPAPPKL